MLPGWRVRIISYRPKKFPDYMSLIHTRLPLGRRVGGVLPAVVADTAKAEGVAFGVAGILFVAGVLAVRRTARCARRGESLRPKATPSVSRLRREPAPSRGSLWSCRRGRWVRKRYLRPKDSLRPNIFPYYMGLSIHGSLLRELPKAEGVAFGVAGILSVAGILTVRRTAMK